MSEIKICTLTGEEVDTSFTCEKWEECKTFNLEKGEIEDER